jgi:DNA-binding MarR family transcriptional regulator
MILVEITAKGRQVANAYRPIVHQHEKAWFQTLNEQEQRQLIDAFHRLQAALTDSD